MESTLKLFSTILCLFSLGCVPPEGLWYADFDGDGYGDPTTASIEEVSGYIHLAHDCDDADSTIHPGATEIVDGLDNDCDGIIDQKIVFVSSQAYSSALQGVVGAGGRCQELADAADFAAFPDAVAEQMQFKAWLSNSSTEALNRLNHAQVPYVLSDGSTVIAENWDDLVSGDDLDHPIDLTELGSAPDNSLNSDGYYVWTGTQVDGTSLAGQHNCEDWTKSDMSVTALVGRYDAVDKKWTEHPSRSCGEKNYFLYCFQQ